MGWALLLEAGDRGTSGNEVFGLFSPQALTLSGSSVSEQRIVTGCAPSTALSGGLRDSNDAMSHQPFQSEAHLLCGASRSLLGYTVLLTGRCKR